MGMEKYWVITCSVSECHNHYFYLPVSEPEDGTKAGTIWYAISNGWGRKKVAGRSFFMCLDCRRAVQKAQAPEKFVKDVAILHHLDDTVKLACGHEFSQELPAVPSVERRHCTACELAWECSGKIEELPEDLALQVADLEQSEKEQVDA